MFYRIIKEFFLKKIVKKGLLRYKLEDSTDRIKTIGLLIDESDFSQRDLILNELKSFNLDIQEVSVLIFKDKIKAKEVISPPFFSLKDITLTGKIVKPEVQNFVDTPFDLLINFFDEPKPSLTMIAKKSKAKFKIGFSSIDKRINHLIIHSETENIKEFLTESIKYLRILNKL